MHLEREILKGKKFTPSELKKEAREELHEMKAKMKKCRSKAISNKK